MKKLLQKAFDTPLDFPPLSSAVFPDDRVAIVPDSFIVANGAILAALIEHLLDAGVKPGDITVLLSEAEFEAEEKKPTLRAFLPEAIRGEVALHAFRPQRGDSCSILGLDVDGEPVALARPLVDADVVLPIERHYPKPPFGHFGLLSALVPRFCDLPTQLRFQAADGVKGREKILETLSPQIADAADRLGVAMVIEAIVDGRGRVTELVYGKPSAVRRHLENKK